MLHPDRRADRRVEITRPCKVYAACLGRYVAGSTRNLSAGGALLELDRPAPLEPGERVSVGISPTRHPGLLRAGEMRSAIVVRFEPPAGEPPECGPPDGETPECGPSDGPPKGEAARPTPVAVRFATPAADPVRDPDLAQAA